MAANCRCETTVAVINDMTLCGHCDQPCAKRGCDQCATYSKTVSKRVA